MLSEPKRFSARTRRPLASAETELFLSAASAWEIAIKHALGKLPLPAAPVAYVPRMMRETRTLPLAVEARHALRVADLPAHHRDPFDRLLIAQAQLERLRYSRQTNSSITTTSSGCTFVCGACSARGILAHDALL